MTPTGPCPGVEELERLAGGDGAPPGVSEHVEGCARCRERLESARADATFLERVRALSGASLAPEGAPRLAGYRVTGVVSEGAQGVVYRGVQESTSRPVAIKVVRAGETLSARRRLRAEREAEIAASLTHPNIVTVYESRGLADGRTAVVMEYVDGVPLDAWKPEGLAPPARHREMLRVFGAVCGAVHHAHLNGVIHRDLKPDNILVTAEGRPVVLDFGVAKAGGIRTTITGEFAGTPAYASPEQASGRGESIDALTDVYSLGVILYRLVCGAMPYQLEGSIFEIARTIGETPPDPPRRHDPTIPLDLEAIILRALRKDKPLRYQSAASLGRDLERFLAGDPVDARSGSGWYLLRKAVHLNRRRLAWAAAAAVVLVGAAVAVVLSAASAARAEARANEQRERARAENVRARAVTELLREALPGADPAHPELAGIVGAGLGRLYYRLESGAFAGEPEIDEALRRLWGQVYTGLGSGKAAGLIEYSEDSLRNGLVRLRRQFGAEHPGIAAMLHDLAGVLLVRQRFAEAERTCRDALAMRVRLDGQESPKVAETRAVLARILHAAGRRAEAAGEADAALTSLRLVAGREADLAIALMSALKGRVSLENGEPGAAEAPVREALVHRLRHLPPGDPDLLASLSDAAEVADRLPESALAGALCAAWETGPGAVGGAVRADAARLGEPDRGNYRRLVYSGRTGALARLLRLAGAFLGEHDVALVGILVAQVRAAEGERALETSIVATGRAAEILSRRFGPHDFSVLLYVEQSAALLAYMGRAEEAVAVGRRACEIWESVPEGARDVLLAGNTRRRLAWYLSLAGRYDEAGAEVGRAMAEIQDAVGREHRTWALAESTLAYCLGESGDLAGADRASEHALSLAERLPATPVDQLAMIRFVRGHVLCRLGRHGEARRVLEESWHGDFKHACVEFAWRRACCEDLALACQSAGDSAGAEAWRAEKSRDASAPEDPAGRPPGDGNTGQP